MPRGRYETPDVAESKYDDDDVTFLVRKLRKLLRAEAKDFRRGLKDLGLALDDDEIRDVIRHCDLDGDGETHLEFESFVESEMKDAGVQDVLDRLREIVDRGDVDADEFHAGLRKFGITLTVAEADEVTRRFPCTRGPRSDRNLRSRNPRVRYRDFVSALKGAAPATREARAHGDRTATYAVRRLAEEIERCARTRGGDLDLGGVFRDMDADGRHARPLGEIRATLERLLGRAHEPQRAHRRHGVLRRGPARRDPLRRLRQVRAQARPGDGARARASRRDRPPAARRRAPPDYRGAFREIDSDGSGAIDAREFGKAMKNLGLRLSSAELRQLVNLFDANGDGRISYREFVEFVEGSKRDARADAKW
ncbi:protein serine/threonine kinase [Aureococcus anophagefferens]|uniref:Protein serine/threonine kinase n=1 Tax=Aureococcus anophagefferens TaxID=44056 RepID=A0ABR1G020_AURAN